MKSSLFKLMVLFSCLSSLLVGCKTEETIDPQRLQDAINHGIQYLKVMQNPSGSFDGYNFYTLNPMDRYKDDPIGYTIYITWNLGEIASLSSLSSRIQPIVKKAGEYINSRRVEVGGHYYWRWREALPFDADDTVLAHHILGELGYSIKADLSIFTNYDQSFRTWDTDLQEDIDFIVQLNAISYLLSENQTDEEKLQNIIDLFIRDQLKSYYYKYPGPAFLYHLASFNNTAFFFKNKLHANKLSEIMRYKPKSAIYSSYLGYFLVKANLEAARQNALIHSLLKNQLEDGSWAMEGVFYSYDSVQSHGCPALTTSYVLKFLTAYYNQSCNKKGVL